MCDASLLVVLVQQFSDFKETAYKRTHLYSDEKHSSAKICTIREINLSR